MANEKKQNGKKAKYKLLTVLGYVFLIAGLLIIAPVVCPPVLGYHAYTVANDKSGAVGSKGVLVYTKSVDGDGYEAGNVVAVDNSDGGRDVDVYYVVSNENGKVELENAASVDTDKVIGKVCGKTPFFGYLSQLVFSVLGIILTVVIFAIGIAATMLANKMARDNKESGK